MNMDTYVYIDQEYFCAPDRCRIWDWLLDQLPCVKVTRVGSEGDIEFKATPETLDFLEQLLAQDYDEIIFHGTYEQLCELLRDETP